MKQQAIKEKFINRFKHIDGENGFFNFTPYIDGEIGFSIKKKINKYDDNISLLSVYLPRNTENLNDKGMMMVSATYGEEKDGGIIVRDGSKVELFKPLDLTSNKEYYYSIENNNILKKDKEISPIDFVNEIYETHIKSTKLFKGFWIRIKIIFWRVFLGQVINRLSTFFSNLLYLLTGDRYTYEAELRKEVFNGIITAHNIKGLIGTEDVLIKASTKININTLVKGMRGKDKKSITFNFFGYKTSYWIVRTYSITILLSYILFEFRSWKPLILVKIINNNLLSLCFIILSLWFIEGVIPYCLRLLVRSCSEFSVYALYNKQINI